MLAKEECLKSLCRIQCGARRDKKCEDCECFDNKVNIWKCVENTQESIVLRKLIEEHFKDPDQTLDFKHFKLYSDNTLKNMNKEELVSYIHMLYRNWTSCDKTCQNLINHAKKLSDSNDELRKQLYFCEPYKVEELHENMWVWDEINNDCRQIAKINEYGGIYWHGTLSEYEADKFEEGRFFPVTKAMQYQEEIKEMKRKDYKKDE